MTGEDLLYCGAAILASLVGITMTLYHWRQRVNAATTTHAEDEYMPGPGPANWMDR